MVGYYIKSFPEIISINFLSVIKYLMILTGSLLFLHRPRIAFLVGLIVYSILIVS